MRLPNIFLFIIVFFTLINLSDATDTVPPAQLIEASQVLPMDSSVIHGQFSNGLTYYIRTNHKPENRAELRLVINAGSILEEDQQQGLAHFVEHMAFNGTVHFEKQELINYLESVGMRFGPDLNAYTSFDETVYMLQVPTDSLEILEKAFLILSDWAHGISMTSEEIDKERGVVREEWRLGQGAGKRMMDKQFPVLLHNSHYANRLPIGQKAVLDTFQHEALRSFYKNWYRPDLMAVIAVGDFDPEKIFRLIRNNFATIPLVTAPAERTVFPVPDHAETLYAVTADSEATYSRISIYYKHPVKAENTAGAFRQHLIERLFNRMLNERLSELTQKSDPPFIYAVSRSGQMIRSKNFYILSAVVQDNGITRGLTTLLKEAKRAQTFGFAESELQRNKSALLRAAEQLYEERDKTNSTRFTAQCVGHFLYDNALPDPVYKYELEKRFLPLISLGEVNDMAVSLITEKNRVVLTSLPLKAGLPTPSENQLAGVIDSIQFMPIEPYIDKMNDQPLLSALPQPGQIVSETHEQSMDVTEWRLSNGIRVIFKPTDFQNDEVRMTAFSPGGTSLIADSNLVAAETAIGIIMESGIGPFKQTMFKKYLAGKIVRVSPYLGEISEGLSGFSSPKDLKTMFQLIYSYFNAVREDSTAFNTYRQRLNAIYQNRNASPEAVYYDTLTATITQHHPRYKPWSVESLKQMDQKKSMAVYKDRFADASDFTFIFVGNLDADSLKPLVKTYIASLPSIAKNETWKNNTYAFPTGIIEKKVLSGKEPKSKTSIIFTGPFDWNRENRYIANSLLEVLDIKLRERLREDLGGTYSVNIYGNFQHLPLERFRISFQFGCDPDRIDELKSEIFLQIDSIKTNGPDESYLQKVRESQLRAYETNLKKNEFWISNLEFQYFHDQSIEDLLKYPDLVNGLTSEAIRDAANRYLDMDNYIRVILLPENYK